MTERCLRAGGEKDGNSLKVMRWRNRHGWERGKADGVGYGIAVRNTDLPCPEATVDANWSGSVLCAELRYATKADKRDGAMQGANPCPRQRRKHEQI